MFTSNWILPLKKCLPVSSSLWEIDTDVGLVLRAKVSVPVLKQMVLVGPQLQAIHAFCSY